MGLSPHLYTYNGEIWHVK